LWSIELRPFKAAIEFGVDLVMVAHLTAPDYQTNAEEPATMSTFWIQDILKGRLGYRGGIITDAMNMGGITQNYSDEYALIRAINAGSDIIIQNQDFKKSIDVVERAVLKGRIPESRINAAAYRTLLLKEKAGLHNQNRINFEYLQKTLGINEHRKIAGKMASEAITLVKNDGGILPLNPGLEDTLYIFDLYDYNNNHSESMATKKLKSGGRKTLTFQIDKSDSLDYARSLLKQIPENALIIVNAFVNPVEHKDEIFLPQAEAEFLHFLNAHSDRVILVSFGSPYIIQEFPETPVYICAYKDMGLMHTALAKALLGKKDISGRLPVSIPGVAEIGDGISIKSRLWKNNSRSASPGRRLKRIMPSEINADTDPVINFMQSAIADSAWPGAVLLAAKKGKIFIHEAAGFHTYDRQEKTSRGDIFDLASITKIAATTSAVMKLYEQGKLDLDDKVVKYLPGFKGIQKEFIDQKNNITIKNLLTHSSGLPSFKQYYLMPGTRETRLDSIYNTEPIVPIGEQTLYSDVGLIILGKLIEKVSGTGLDAFVDTLIFKKLGMNSTYFNPPPERIKRIVPTEYNHGKGIFTRGYVHDENALSLGGVAGHAGLFSSAYDLGIFSQTMLNGGLYGWQRIFKQETVDLFTMRALVVEGSSRCLGWDSPSGRASGGIYLSSKSYGHTGFTGTSLWIDPENEIFVILLTNAVHPDRKNKNPQYYDWRQRIHSAVYESLGLNQQNPELKERERWKNQGNYN
ncbi:MAG: serine hydrolase, partial [Candidatus Neomarinimicrobiota bacterium]